MPERLDIYRSLSNLTAVRQHLGWDNHLEHLKGADLRCGLEVFAPQLPDLLNVVRQYPEIGFTVAVMGWPIDLGVDGYGRWQTDLDAISRCGNTCVSISAVECIFGMNGTKSN